LYTQKFKQLLNGLNHKTVYKLTQRFTSKNSALKIL